MSLTESLAQELQSKTPWQFACDWYKESEFKQSIERDRALVPDPADLDKFVPWLVYQCRLAMNKGIEIGRAAGRRENERQPA